MTIIFGGEKTLPNLVTGPARTLLQGPPVTGTFEVTSEKPPAFGYTYR